MKLVLVLPLFLLFGCASKQYLVNEDTSFNGPNQKISYVRGSGSSIYIDRFQDFRPDKDVLGRVATGISNEVTPVNIDSGKLPRFASNYFTKAFIKRGISVGTKDDANFILKAAVKKFWVNETSPAFGAEAIECSAEVDYFIYRRAGHGLVWQGRMNLSYRHPSALFDTTRKTSEAIGSCMNELVERLIALDKFQSLLGIEIVK
ncbi:MAG: hypothetical protein KAG61_11515 [Bacteriovoracaceae bacterium]|nr:hypothetical protein [Bacteriovoracaceae bacterium]